MNRSAKLVAACLICLSVAACGAGGDQKKSADTAATSATPAADNVDTTGGAKLADFTGDASKGGAIFGQCQSCHALEPGLNRIGPSLHGVVGSKPRPDSGYRYSEALSKSGVTWTEEKLFQFLENPRRVVPGNKMAFAGIPDPQKRADLIAWLATQK